MTCEVTRDPEVNKIVMSFDQLFQGFHMPFELLQSEQYVLLYQRGGLEHSPPPPYQWGAL